MAWIGRYKKICAILSNLSTLKTVRVENQGESIIPDISLAPNEKISLDIFGPLPINKKRNKC